MPAKRGDRVAPPAGHKYWDVIFGTSEAAKGWEDLCTQAAGNTRAAWEILSSSPRPNVRTERQHPLKGGLEFGTYRGATLDQWQIEVTGGGRIWYLIDDEHR